MDRQEQTGGRFALCLRGHFLSVRLVCHVVCRLSIGRSAFFLRCLWLVQVNAAAHATSSEQPLGRRRLSAAQIRLSARHTETDPHTDAERETQTRKSYRQAAQTPAVAVRHNDKMRHTRQTNEDAEPSTRGNVRDNQKTEQTQRRARAHRMAPRCMPLAGAPPCSLCALSRYAASLARTSAARSAIVPPDHTQHTAALLPAF